MMYDRVNLEVVDHRLGEVEWHKLAHIVVPPHTGNRHVGVPEPEILQGLKTLRPGG